MLREVQADGRTDIAASAVELTSREKRRGLVFILSDFLVPSGVAQAMDRLRYHGHELTLIRVVSGVDQTPPVSGEVEILDSETGQKLRAVVTPAVLKRYREKFEQIGRQIEAAALKKGARLVTITAEDPFDDHISTILRSIGKHK
jgi:hypothetical protein